MRIAKYIAQAGCCSRRTAETWILAGRVQVNGEILISPAFNVPEDAEVRVDGKVVHVSPSSPLLWRFHKPKGCITSHYDPQGRTTIFDVLPKSFANCITIGRLDYNTEGLLLLTNNGDLAQRLMHPSAQLVRIYHIKVYGHMNEKALADLAHGVTMTVASTYPQHPPHLVHYGAVQAQILQRGNGKNHWISMMISEGKNREIRNICHYLGLEVNRLIRVSYGDILLDGLGVGQVEQVNMQALTKSDT